MERGLNPRSWSIFVAKSREFWNSVNKKKRLSLSAENWILASGRFWLFGLRVKDERRVCVKFLKRRGAAAAEHYYTMADRG